MVFGRNFTKFQDGVHLKFCNPTFFWDSYLMREQLASLLWTFASASSLYFAWNEYTQYKSIEPKTIEEVKIRENHGLDAIDYTFMGVAAAVQIPPADYLPKSGLLRAPVAGLRIAMLGTFGVLATMRLYKNTQELFNSGKEDKNS